MPPATFDDRAANDGTDEDETNGDPDDEEEAEEDEDDEEAVRALIDSRSSSIK